MKNTNNVSYLKRGLLSGAVSFVFVMTLIGISTALGFSAPDTTPPTGLASPTFSGLTVKDPAGKTLKFGVDSITFSDNEGMFYSPSSVEHYIYVPGVWGTIIHADDILTTSGTVQFSGQGGDRFVVNPGTNGDVKIGNATSPVNVLGTFNTSDTATIGKKLTVSSGGAAITGNVSITGTTTSSGKISANGGLDVTGNMTTSGITTSSGKLTISSGGSDITGNVTAKNNLYVYGNLASSGNPLIAGYSGLKISDNLTVGGWLNFDATTSGGGYITNASVISPATGKILYLQSDKNVDEIQLKTNGTMSLRGTSIEVNGNLLLSGKLYKLDGVTNYLKPVKATGTVKTFAGGASGYLNDTFCPTGYYAISCEYTSSGGYGFYVTDIATAMSGSTGYCSIAGMNTTGTNKTVTGYANCVNY